MASAKKIPAIKKFNNKSRSFERIAFIERHKRSKVRFSDLIKKYVYIYPVDMINVKVIKKRNFLFRSNFFKILLNITINHKLIKKLIILEI